MLKPNVLKNIGIVKKDIIRLANWTHHQSDLVVLLLKVSSFKPKFFIGIKKIFVH